MGTQMGLLGGDWITDIGNRYVIPDGFTGGCSEVNPVGRGVSLWVGPEYTYVRMCVYISFFLP